MAFDLAEDLTMDSFPSLFSFRGRSGRAAYWLVAVYQLGIVLLLVLLTGFVAGSAPEAAQQENYPLLVVWLIGGLVFAWMGVAASVRRWHDRDKSAWWLLVGGVPVIGPIWVFVELGCLAGTPGGNRFGPPPGNVFAGWADAPAASGEDLDGIVARWASTTVPPAASAAAPRRAALSSDRPPVIVRSGREGGFGRRGLR